MSRHAFARTTGVSRETLERLDTYAALLTRWNRRINLVAPSTLEDIWTRHFLDSAQLWSDDPLPARWLDLGSGAGFPGLVIALLAKDRGAGVDVALVEADARKVAFLRNAALETGVEVSLRTDRVERMPPWGADVVSARALAPLSTLIGYAHRHLSQGGRTLLLKGRRYRSELTEANRSWHMKVAVQRSVTDAEGAVLTVTDIEERA